MKLKIDNKIICFTDYTSYFERLKGFMFVKKPITKGIRFKNCSSIHTMFMLQKIDIIMTDKNNRIIKLYKNMTPWKIILPKKGIYYTYELPINSVQNIYIDEILEFEK